MFSKEVVIPLKLSPSYLPNNLSILSQSPLTPSNYHKTIYAIIHKNTLNLTQHDQQTTQIVYNPESFPNVLDLSRIKQNPFILNAKWCSIGSSFFIVICCYHMLLIYDRSGTNLLSVIPIVYSTAESKSPYAKGISVYGNFLCIGFGNNKIIVYQVKELFVGDTSEISVEVKYTLEGHNGPISSLSTDKFGNLVSADDNGMVCLWTLIGNEDLSIQAPNIIFKSSDNPCTSVVFCGEFIIASFGSGQLKFYNKTSMEMEFEVNAHARWINAIDVCQKNQWIMAVSEDTCVSIWQIPSDRNGTVECLFYQSVQSCVLTGCTFLDENGAFFALTAYDHNGIIIYKLTDNPKNTE